MLEHKLEILAQKFSAEYEHIYSFSGLLVISYPEYWSMKLHALKHWLQTLKIVSQVKKIYDTSTSSDEAIARRYDVEYEGSDGPHYRYFCALLVEKFFLKITGYRLPELKNKKILDVGAGSNELLRYLEEHFDVQPKHLYGSDVSEASRDVIIANGHCGYHGRIEDIHFPANEFDTVFLTYFY
jgi:ubiquinone/menaquinone biosynthesis C-methylase UbiE